MENIINEKMTLNNIEENLEKEQTNFLDTLIGKAVNTAIDIGIRAVLPDFIEEQVINLKDNLLENGIKDGIKKTVEEAIDMGKGAISLFKGDFENIDQMKEVVKKGGVIDGISELWDFAVDKVRDKGIINNSTASILGTGKDAFLNSIENNIEKSFEIQNKNQTNIEENINNWKEAFENQDFEKMQKEFDKIEKEIKELVPLEKIINEARNIENLHTLIKNNGQDFNLTQEQLELAQKI